MSYRASAKRVPAQTVDAQFGWRHRGDHFRGGVWEMMQQRAAEGRDPGQDEAADAKQSDLKQENRRARENVWMRA
jgi:hypothetical protein